MLQAILRMKKIFLILIVLSLTSYRSETTIDVLTKKDAQMLVTDFMNTMKNILYEKQGALEKYILPTELKKYKDSYHYNGVNSFVIEKFIIIKTKLPFIVIKIKHPKAKDQKKWNWVKELTFKVQLYHEQPYIVPSNSNGNYINPWWSIKEL